MPIYAYRCEACGFAKDVLQKISDAPLTDCESCGKSAMKKQVTAAGFQLKGSGWYVTDFRGGGSGGSGAAGSGSSAGNTAGKSGDAGASSDSAGTASSGASETATSQPAAQTAS